MIKVYKTILLLLLATSIYANSNLKKTILSGFLEDHKDTSLLINLWIIDPVNFINSSRRIVTYCDHGYFRFELDISHPVYFAILDTNEKLASFDNERIVGVFFNSAIHPYVEPHDSIFITIKPKDNTPKFNRLLNVQFSGKGAEKNICLQKIFNLLNTSIQSILDNQNFGNTLLIKCNQVIDQNKSRFNETAFELLKADVAGIIDNAIYGLLVNLKQTDSSYKGQINDYLRQVLGIKIKVSDMLQYSAYCKNLLCKQAIILRLNRLNILRNRSYLYGLTLKEFTNIIDSAYKGYIREYLVAKPLMDEMVLRSNMNSEVKYCLKQFFLKSRKGSIYNEQLKNEYRLLSKILNKNILDFNLLDTFGNLVNLSKYKGKLIFIDFMFTGCSGCAKAVPYLSKFEERFKNDTNIVFISISTDINFALWKLKGIGNYSVKNSIQLNTGKSGYEHPIAKYFNIHEFPTFLLIDKHSKILFKRALTTILDDIATISNIIKDSEAL